MVKKVKVFFGIIATLTFLQITLAQTQDSVVADTGRQIIDALRQVKQLTVSLKEGINSRSSSIASTFWVDFNLFYNAQQKDLTNNVSPLESGTTNVAVLNVLTNLRTISTRIFTKMVNLRETVINKRTAFWQASALRAEMFGSRDLTASLHALMKHMLNKYVDNTVNPAMVANCRQSAFINFNITIRATRGTIENCGFNPTIVFEKSQTDYITAFRILYFLSDNLLNTALTSCLNNNGIENAWAIDWVTDAQRNGFVNCLTAEINNVNNNALFNFDTTALALYVTSVTTDGNNLFNCFE